MKVPFVDLATQYEAIQEEVTRAMEEVLHQSAFSLGPYVEAFESEFAEFCDSSHCAGVSSGTAALHLALRAHDIGKGDEVITTPFTFIATMWAISYVGATPVLVDIEPRTCTIDASQIEAAITARTRAVIPVHLYGQMADMNAVLDIAKREDLLVIEDAAQAHGATYNGATAGSLGDIGCFSFYPGKNLGAYGEAGAVVCSDQVINERVRRLRDHGQPRKYVHEEIGYNYRLDGLQGAVLSAKLQHLSEWNRARRRIADEYRRRLGAISEIRLPHERDDSRHVYHIFSIALPSQKHRDRLQGHLASRGVATGLHYPLPVHLQPAYSHLGYEAGAFPASEEAAHRRLSLPMFPELTDEQVDFVAQVIKECPLSPTY